MMGSGELDGAERIRLIFIIVELQPDGGGMAAEDGEVRAAIGELHAQGKRRARLDVVGVGYGIQVIEITTCIQ